MNNHPLTLPQGYKIEFKIQVFQPKLNVFDMVLADLFFKEITENQTFRFNTKKRPIS